MESIQFQFSTSTIAAAAVGSCSVKRPCTFSPCSAHGLCLSRAAAGVASKHLRLGIGICGVARAFLFHDPTVFQKPVLHSHSSLVTVSPPAPKCPKQGDGGNGLQRTADLGHL